MFTPSGPNPPTPRSPQDQDDWLAILVALGILGGLGGWLIFSGFPSLTTPLTETPDSVVTPPAVTDSGAPLGGEAVSGDGTIIVPDPALPPSPSTEEALSGNTGPESGSSSITAPATTAPDRTGPSSPEQPALVVPDPQIPDSASASSLPPIRPAIAFTDVADDYWAKPYIDALTARGVLNGLPDGSFAPNRPLTRAELAAQVAPAFEVEPKTVSAGFADVPADYWAAATIDESVALGFMTGYPDRTFQPNQVVPRLQVLVTLATGLSLPKPPGSEALLQGYADQGTIPAWGRDQVAAAIAAGLIAPGATADSQLRPNDPATRAEVAALIYSALVYMGKVEPVE